MLTHQDYSREYLAYCTSQKRKPSDQLAHDKKRYPGGCMCGFICWMSEQLSKFRNAHPEACMGQAIVDHDAKCAFLEVVASSQ